MAVSSPSRPAVGGAQAEPAAEARTSRIGTGYRPHLDGIRTVAVYLGVAFHARVDRLMGGFIGVDMFFVLSGYLVTQLLMRDLAGGGSISLRRFYSRRIRRLLPAAATALLATMVVFTAVASPAELPEGQNAISAAALHVSNWYFIAQSVEYFGADLQSNPVVQFWSLSVEEQFYAAWPLLLSGLLLVARRGGRHRWSIVQGIVLTGIVASFAAALWLAQTNLDRAYYGTDTRAYQLLGGSLLALSPGALVRLHNTSAIRRVLPLAALGSLGGLLLLGTALLEMGAIVRGALAATLTLTLIASMEAEPSGVTRWLLSRPAIVYLGRISYGTYLWHWLVIVVATRVVADISPTTTFLLSALVASGMSALSYEVIERPVREARRLDRRRLTVVVVGLSTSIVMGLVVAPRLVRPDQERRPVTVAQGTSVGATRVPDDLDWEGAQNDIADFPECTSNIERCTLVEGTGPHLLLIGDSHARMYIPMLSALATDRELTFSAAVVPACPWQGGLQYRMDAAECRRQQAELYPGVVDRLDPDVVIVANRSFDAPGSPLFVADEAAGELPPGSTEYLDSVETRTAAALQQFRSAGRKVVIIDPVPVAPLGTDPVVCLADATYVDECRYVKPTPVESIYRRLAEADDGVWTLDLDREVCPYLPICDPIVGGLIVKRDTSHLTTRFALTLLDSFEQFLDDNRILD